MWDAKDRELKSLISIDAFEVVAYENQVTLSSCWVISEKYKGGERKNKGRLVSCGFEEKLLI